MASGRISDVVIHPSDRATWYVAVGSGGVWKTSDAGTTWTPIFDRENSYSIGCIAVDAGNPNTVWVGSGENVSGRHVGFGDGIYKSLDGGKTWKNMGLKNSEHIAKIIIDPRDSNVIYAAAEGGLWSPGAERGVFKSSDGGATWQAALQISKDTGVTDIAMDLQNPAVLYAAAYQRRRSVAAFMAGGPESGIYKTVDSGKHWQKLSSGLPQGHMRTHRPGRFPAKIRRGLCHHRSRRRTNGVFTVRLTAAPAGKNAVNISATAPVPITIRKSMPIRTVSTVSIKTMSG